MTTHSPLTLLVPTSNLRWAKKKSARQFLGGLIATVANSKIESTHSRHSTSHFSNRNKIALSGNRHSPLPALAANRNNVALMFSSASHCSPNRPRCRLEIAVTHSKQTIELISVAAVAAFKAKAANRTKRVCLPMASHSVPPAVHPSCLAPSPCISNRPLCRLEIAVTHSKQTTEAISNRPESHTLSSLIHPSSPPSRLQGGRLAPLLRLHCAGVGRGHRIRN
jgi:hypothetical protein